MTSHPDVSGLEIGVAMPVQKPSYGVSEEPGTPGTVVDDPNADGSGKRRVKKASRKHHKKSSRKHHKKSSRKHHKKATRKHRKKSSHKKKATRKRTNRRHRK